MVLETDRGVVRDVTLDQLRAELALLDGDDSTRAVPSQGDEAYLQTAWFENGFVVEKREGSEDRHFHAVPPHAPLGPLRAAPKRSWFQRRFTASNFQTSECALGHQDMMEMFAAYFEGREPGVQMRWEAGYCDR